MASIHSNDPVATYIVETDSFGVFGRRGQSRVKELVLSCKDDDLYDATVYSLEAGYFHISLHMHRTRKRRHKEIIKNALKVLKQHRLIDGKIEDLLKTVDR